MNGVTPRVNEEQFLSGFVAIAGRPNVGKSTLLNKFLGHKLAIMSDKPQTTRNRILGILNRPGAQIVFLDTPGIHKPHHRLGEYMVKVAERTLHEVDVILAVMDATAPPGEGDRRVAQMVSAAGTPAILVLNKIDEIPRGAVLETLGQYRALGEFLDAVPISALEGRNVEALLDIIIKQLQPGPRYYPEDIMTDQPEQFVISELIREKVLHLTREEVPHSVAVEVDELARRREDLVYVKASVYVERDSQKGILVGEGGRMLREIGRLAREDIEALLGSKIYLDLWVKVKKDWRDKPTILRQLGYEVESDR